MNHGNENKLIIFVTELLGTLLLSLSLSLAWTQNNIITSYDPVIGTVVYSDSIYNLYIMAGLCLYSLFYIFSPISGGHFNPAVTIAVYISLAFNTTNVVLLFITITA